MARIVPIETAGRLEAALELFERAHPGAMDRNGRGRDHYRGLMRSSRALLLAMEDSDSMRAVLVGGQGRETESACFDIAVEPPASFAISSELRRAAVRIAADRGWAQIFTSAASEAPVLEESGFSPTLLVQVRGDDRHALRDEVVRDLRGRRRVLDVREWQGEVAQAVFRTDRVDTVLAKDLDLAGWRRYCTWLMWHWADPDRRPRHVVRFHDRYARPVLEELRDVDPELEPKARLHGGEWEVPAGRPGYDLGRAAAAEGSIFQHHLAPVEAEATMTGTREDLALLATMAALPSLQRRPTFAVECRKGRNSIAGRHAETAFSVRDVEIRVGTALAAQGFTVDLSQLQ